MSNQGVNFFHSSGKKYPIKSMPTYNLKICIHVYKEALKNTIVCFFVSGTIMTLKYSKNVIDRRTKTTKPRKKEIG